MPPNELLPIHHHHHHLLKCISFILSPNLEQTTTHAHLQTLSETPTCTNCSHSISIPPRHTSFWGLNHQHDGYLLISNEKNTFFTSPNFLARKQTKHSSRLPPIKPPPKQKQPSSSGCLFCSAVRPACATNASKKGLAGSSRKNVMARNGDGEEFGKERQWQEWKKESRGSQCSGHHSHTLARCGDRHTEKEEGMRLFFTGRQSRCGQ